MRVVYCVVSSNREHRCRSPTYCGRKRHAPRAQLYCWRTKGAGWPVAGMSRVSSRRSTIASTAGCEPRNHIQRTEPVQQPERAQRSLIPAIRPFDIFLAATVAGRDAERG
jgi:hypothetical protein